MRVATKEEKKDLSNNQKERVNNVYKYFVTYLTLSRNQETKIRLKQETFANVKCLLICFVRERFKDLVRNLSIMSDLKISKMIKRNVQKLEIDVARQLKKLLKITFENDARNAIASTFLTLRSIKFATNTKVAIVHKRKLCIIKDVFTRNRKRLKSHRKLICIQNKFVDEQCER